MKYYKSMENKLIGKFANSLLKQNLPIYVEFNCCGQVWDTVKWAFFLFFKERQQVVNFSLNCLYIKLPIFEGCSTTLDHDIFLDQ